MQTKIQKDQFLAQLLTAYKTINVLHYRSADILYCRAVPLKAIQKAIIPAMSMQDFKANCLAIRKNIKAHPTGYSLEFGYARDQKLALAIGTERLSSLTIYDYEIR